ncbi:Cytochrome c1 heme lyase [Coemansia sp. RSA 1824]|nr:Cytochrome c1 heme lyase [Coemansia sp. RSA 1824]
MAVEPASSGCPVDHAKLEPAKCPVDHTTSAKSEPAKCPIDHTANAKPEAATCPVDHTSSLKAFLPNAPSVNPSNNMPLVPEQTPTDTSHLSTHRTISSIPRAARYESAGPSECPALDSQTDNWVYPSEQMFYNAMKRKNWSPHESDMKTVVPIHNVVNEMCWARILEWEQMHENKCGGPRLLRFEGKIKNVTPKARLRSFVGYQLPFDRHDWTVDRCGKPVRYVIDFYQGKTDPKNPNAPSFFLDVRPALTVEGAWDRTRRFFGF